MKRTTFSLFLAILLVSFTSSFTLVSFGDDVIEVKKGKLIDYDHDGNYDFLSFKVKTKSGKALVPVVCISAIRDDGTKVQDLPLVNFKLKKKMSKYYVDLRGKEISGDFLLEITFDTSQIEGDSDADLGPMILSDGGPGGTNQETIIIIKYP